MAFPSWSLGTSTAVSGAASFCPLDAPWTHAEAADPLPASSLLPPTFICAGFPLNFPKLKSYL